MRLIQMTVDKRVHLFLESRILDFEDADGHDGLDFIEDVRRIADRPRGEAFRYELLEKAQSLRGWFHP